jgi:hypothetical protein
LFCSIFLNRVFGRFVTRGVQKRDKKKSRENLLSFQKKYLLTYVTFFFFFFRGPPWSGLLCRTCARRAVPVIYKLYTTRCVYCLFRPAACTVQRPEGTTAGYYVLRTTDQRATNEQPTSKRDWANEHQRVEGLRAVQRCCSSAVRNGILASSLPHFIASSSPGPQNIQGGGSRGRESRSRAKCTPLSTKCRIRSR